MDTNTETVTIRNLEYEDIDGVIAIEQEAYGDHHWSKDSFAGEIKNELARYYALFEPNGELAGYAGCWHILEEAHITTIAVSKKYRRKKYAEALLRHVIENCYQEGVKYITLEVRVSNTPAINLYNKYGFASFGTRKAYYQDNNEDALIMWTKNIFFDEFKENYQKVIAQLEEKISINE